jgi:hypothetical protein
VAAAPGGVEESPDSTGHGCWREPGRGDLPVQGNREQTADGVPPGNRRLAQARVKRCGKSAPASGATPAAGNPHPEQGQAWDGWPGRCPQVGRTDGWPPGRRPQGHHLTESGLQADSPSLIASGLPRRQGLGPPISRQTTYDAAPVITSAVPASSAALSTARPRRWCTRAASAGRAPGLARRPERLGSERVWFTSSCARSVIGLEQNLFFSTQRS